MKVLAWGVAGALCAMVLVAVGGALALADLLDSLPGVLARGVEIVVDGRRITVDDIPPLRALLGMDTAVAVLAIGAGLFMLMLVLATLAPLVLLIVVGALLLGLAPLWLLLLALWLALRKPKATMAR